jgi:hypothetical protein
MRTPTAIAILAIVAAVAGGCGHDRPGNASAEQREDPNSAHEDLTREIACFRAHGLPSYPDPVFDPNDGRWHLANERPALTAAVRQACASVMPQSTPASPIPTTQLQDLIQYARCLRSHGVPDWPDPKVDGTFHTNINLKSDANRPALAACDKYLASSGGTISLGQPDD